MKDLKRSKCVFEPTYVDINDDHLPGEERSDTKAKYMKELYPDAVEDKPTDEPPPKVKRVQMNCFVDANNCGDQVTRRSRTEILI